MNSPWMTRANTMRTALYESRRRMRFSSTKPTHNLYVTSTDVEDLSPCTGESAMRSKAEHRISGCQGCIRHCIQLRKAEASQPCGRCRCAQTSRPRPRPCRPRSARAGGPAGRPRGRPLGRSRIGRTRMGMRTRTRASSRITRACCRCFRWRTMGLPLWTS